MMPHEYDALRAMEDEHWWYAVLRWLVVRELEQRLPQGARILDAGCGTGGMIAMLHRWQVEGIDSSEQAIQHCTQRGLPRVQIGTVEALPWEDKAFDAVLCLDVLYHVAVQEETAMQEMLRVLRPGGFLVLNLPAFDCLSGGHDMAVCGARRYKRCHVQRWLEAHKVRIKMMHYWNAWLFVPLLVWRWFHRAAESDLRQAPQWLNAILVKLGKVDARICRALRVPWGSSIFAVVQKPEEI